jgi:hypothetical protein
MGSRQLSNDTVTEASGAAAVPDPSAPDDPRIVEEHHIVGANGEDELEAIDDRGRRWYHPRPEPRGRADILGFNYTWWLILLVLALLGVGGGKPHSRKS